MHAPQEYPDLLRLLAEARRLVPDDRFIWCVAADGFDSRLSQRRGMLLGGAISPHWLKDADSLWSDVPWTVALRNCRVLVCDRAAHEPIPAWLPLLEGLAKAGESLLVVTETMASELLRMLVVNHHKATLSNGVVRSARDRYGSPLPGMESLGHPSATPPGQHDRLPLIAEAWIRRTATVLFPAATTTLSSAAMHDITIIETGGENHDDQYERLRFLMRALQTST